MDGNDNGIVKMRARDSLTAVLRDSNGNVKMVKTVDSSRTK